MIRLEARPAPSRLWSWLTPILSLVLTMVTASALFAALGTDPMAVLRAIFWDPLFGEFAFYYRPQLLVKAAPLILLAVGLAMGFRAGVWNIGAEGQYIIGALCGGGVALAAFPMESALLYPLMIVAAMAGGWAWAMIPALLKTKRDVNEILVSLMLVYVAENLLAFMALGPMRNPEGMGFPGSRNLAQYPSASNPELIAGTGAHLGVFAAALVAALALFVFARHIFGFQIRLSGDSPRAARFAGVNPARMIVACMGIAGALAGLAGLFELTGPAGQISIDFNVGYGFTAIIVAYLGRLHPIGIVLAGAIMALTYIGGEIAQNSLGLPLAAIQVFQGMLLFFILGLDVFRSYRLRIGKETRS